MTNLPDPLVPADLDLSSLEYMPLLLTRLRRSKAWLRAKRKPELAFYMINVWMTAWGEKPASSLEDDDDILADAAMCEPAKWPKIKEQVMQGFIRCGDGRLYHPVLAEQALKALDKRMKWRTKKATQRGQSEDGRPEPPHVPLDVPGDNEGTEQGTTLECPPGQLGGIGGETPLMTGRDGKVDGKGCASGIVSLPNSEFKSLDSGKNTIPERATPGGPSDDDRAAERQGAWFQRAAVEVRLLMSDDEADALIAGALGGDPKAKAQVERIWANRARGAG